MQYTIPDQILINIFKYLDGADLRMAASACTSWLNVCKRSEFAPLFHLHPRGVRSAPPYPTYVAKTLYNYSAATFESAEFNSVDVVEEFCAVHGHSLQRIVLRDCVFECSALLAALSSPLRLTHLELDGCRFDEFPTEDTQRIRHADIRHLTLQHLPSLTDAQFGALASMMPHLSALSLCDTWFSCHPGLQRRFYPPTGSDDQRLPSRHVLTFGRIGDFICGPAAANLTHLDFSHTTINDAALSRISSCEQLDLIGLRLTQCHELTAVGLVKLFGQQTNLQQLDLSGVRKLDDSCLESLFVFQKNLRELRLADCCWLTDEGVQGVWLLRRLRVLDISCNRRLSCGALVGLANLRHDCLHELHLRACRFEASIEDVFRNCPNLRVLDVRDNPTWKPIALQWIGKYLLGLRVLLMAKSDMFAEDTHIGVPSSAARDLSGLRALHTLNISGCRNATDNFLDCLRLPELLTLRMAQLNGITNWGVERLAHNSPAIRSLDLTDCRNVGGTRFVPVACRLHRLTQLRMAGCGPLTNEALFALHLNSRWGAVHIYALLEHECNSPVTVSKRVIRWKKMQGEATALQLAQLNGSAVASLPAPMPPPLPPPTRQRSP